MKKQALFICALLITVLAVGQSSYDASNKVDVKVGEIFKGEKKATLSDIWAVHDNHFYTKLYSVSMFGNSNDYIARFNSEMSLENFTELDMSQGDEKKELERLMSLKNEKLYCLSNFKNKDQGKRYLFVQTIDKETLLPNDDVKMIAEIGFETNKEAKSTNYRTRISNDSTKVLVLYNPPYDKESPEKFGMKVYDEDFELLWEKEQEIKYTDKEFSLGSIKLSNDGDVYISGKVYSADADKGDKGNQKVIAFTDEGKTIKEYNVELDGKDVRNFAMGITEEKRLVCSGFYSDEGTNGLSGCFLVAIDLETQEKIKESIEEFTIDFITEDLKEKHENKLKKKDAKGKDVDFHNYYLSDFIRRNDGGAVLIGEQYWSKTVTTTDQNGNTRTKTYYYYFDLIVINIDPEGNIEWASKVPKRQKTVNDLGRYSSYMSAVVDDDIYIIFNDNPKNLMYNGDGNLKYMQLKDAFATLITVDSDGLVFRQSLVSTKGDKIIVKPKVSEQIRDDELLMYAERGKNRAFINVKFK